MDKVKTLKLQGNDALKRGDVATAICVYTEAIALEKDNYVLYSNRSAAYAQGEQYEQALLDAEMTIKLKPDWPKGYSRKGTALTFLNRNEEAVQAYQQGLQYDPTNELLKKGFESLKKPKIMKDIPNVFNMPGTFDKLNSNPHTQAFMKDPNFVQMIRDLQNSPSSLSNLLHDDRVHTALQVLLGIEVMDEGDMDTKSFIHTKEHPISGSTADGVEKKDGKVTLEGDKSLKENEAGNTAYKKKNFINAMTHYTKALEFDASNMTFMLNIAAVHFETKEYLKCIEACEKAVEIGRENRANFKLIAKAFLRSGNAYMKLGDMRAAKAAFEKSMSEHRTTEIKAILSQIDKKIKDEEKRAYIDPVKAELAKETGNEYFNKGNYAEALKYYSEAILRNPDEAKYYSNRAAAYTKLVAFDLGLRDCKKCVELDPTFVKGWLREGKILLGMQQPNKAIVSYQRAIELDPSNREATDGYKACMMSINSNPDEVRKQALADPEIQAIMRDPAMRMILEQMQSDPMALSVHIQNPEIAAKLQKLLESGVIAIR